MADIFLYNRFDKSYCSCGGSVCQGKEISFSVKLMRTQLTRVNLVVIYDKTGVEERIPMLWYALNNGYDVYRCSLKADYKGIIWYYFEAVNNKGERVFFGENTPSDVMCTYLPAAYQLTVHDAGISVPNWYCQGVTYHVFVDRFYRASSSLPVDVNDPDYLVHTSIHDIPEYLPDKKGEILNRDIYGGNLKGIEEKLEYLKSLGVVTVYLSPIFEAWSNHKYNTADYMKIDPHFGDENDLRSLCKAAEKMGMHVILDGVFNHTGSDSVYFNAKGRYDTVGAAQSQDSEYRDWYSFNDSHVGYESWWGINTLPSVNEMTESYREFIINGENSVCAHWINAGISGWRLDVADELPDEFLMQFHSKAKACKADALVIGEVWEDASNKVAYGVRRSYFSEKELDGVMNYPIKDGILNFLTNRISSHDLKRTMCSILEHYPQEIHKGLMNLIGTHDTMRAINALACPELGFESRDFKAYHKMDYDTRARGRRLVRMASCLQYMYPGSPSIYYGDEIAMEGFEDPFNRRCYTWDNQDMEMLEHYRKLGSVKFNCKAMHNGKFHADAINDDAIAVWRTGDSECVFCAVNRGAESCEAILPKIGIWREIFTGRECMCNRNCSLLEIAPESYEVWVWKK